MSLSTQPYKGTRDFYPEDQRLQTYLFNTIRRTVENYGYEEYDAPLLEPLDIYLAKTGEEIVNEQTYTLTDRGGRRLAIRPEMTPTVSRMVAARRQELAYPLRWYSIPNLWRYERPQRGRLREHWQLNVDIFGIDSIEAEIEIIELTAAIYTAFGARPEMYEIKLNSRAFMDFLLLEHLGLSAETTHAVAKLIDRLHKMDPTAFEAELNSLVPETAATVLQTVLRATDIQTLPLELKDNPGLHSLAEAISRLQATGLSNVHFDPTVVRGFDYYTDIVFEVFDTHPDNNRSMMGGGRYDGLVGLFGVSPVPTVGFGLGDATLANFLKLHELLPELPTETQLYAVLAGITPEQAAPVVSSLRKAGVRIALDISGRKVGEQLKTASKKAIAYALIIGDKELASGLYTLKDMTTGAESALSVDDMVKILKQPV